MSEFNGLHEGLGEPQNRVQPSQDFFESPLAQINEDLTLLWREDGWARYADGLFWTFDPREGAMLAEYWREFVPLDSIVFGSSAFGKIFFWNAGEVRRLDPQRARQGSLGSSVDIFFNSTVKLQSFQDTLLDRRLFKKVRKRLGILDMGECYGLFPALPLGGNDEDPAGYQRVKMREYLALVAQAHG